MINLDLRNFYHLFPSICTAIKKLEPSSILLQYESSPEGLSKKLGDWPQFLVSPKLVPPRWRDHYIRSRQSHSEVINDQKTPYSFCTYNTTPWQWIGISLIVKCEDLFHGSHPYEKEFLWGCLYLPNTLHENGFVLCVFMA